jgi:REP element-mobilizing transposase RayT
VVLGPAGKTIERVWLDLPRRFEHVCLDEYVIMPNHIHGILRLRPWRDDGREHDTFGEPLSEIVRWFKAQSTRAYIRGVYDLGWARFDGRLWQRGYYEHVIRDEDDLVHGRGYILRNPRRWMTDPDNPRASDHDEASPWV